ncbi:MAG: GNAT family N-acetyltransferase [Bacteroidales bacterium]
MVNIRKATIDDLDSVYSLICDLENQELNIVAFDTIYRFNINSSETIYLVAEIDGRVVGFLSIHIQHILHHSNSTCELQELNVFNEYRSLGIGTQLMQEAERIAKELGLEEIELTTKVFRKRAQEFYTRLGFENTHLKFVKKFN